MNFFENLFTKKTPQKHTIFIVEDNEAYAKLLQNFLMLRFPELHEIKHFITGEDCLKELYKKPTVIILDHLLNKTKSDAATGLSIIKKIKTANSKSKIILLSAQTEIEVVSKTIAKYGEVYIPKNEEAFNKIEEQIKQFVR